MSRPRFSISWLMLAVALIGFHLAVVCTYPPLFNLGHADLEIGLLPGVTVGLITLFWVTRRQGEEKQLFVWRFLASLGVITCAYVSFCLAVPEYVKWPVVYYVNNIEPDLYDADLEIIYRLSLEVDGLILGAPQLFLATCGAAIIQTASEWRRGVVGPDSSRSLT